MTWRETLAAMPEAERIAKALPATGRPDLDELFADLKTRERQNISSNLPRSSKQFKKGDKPASKRRLNRKPPENVIAALVTGETFWCWRRPTPERTAVCLEEDSLPCGNRRTAVGKDGQDLCCSVYAASISVGRTRRGRNLDCLTIKSAESRGIVMKIETERLYIRRLTGEDYALMSSIWGEQRPRVSGHSGKGHRNRPY